MNQQEKETLKEKIYSKTLELKKEIMELEELTRPIPPDNTMSSLTRMDAVNNKSINEGALYLARVKLLKLESALKNVESPFFGICVSCKGQIPFKRIMAMPESFICVDCAED